MQLFLRYKSWQRENTLTCWFRLASANLVMLLRLVPSLNKLTVNKNDELLCQNSSSSMNCLKNDRIWKPRLVLRHPTWAYTLLLLVCCCRAFRLFAPSGCFRVLFYIMLKIPEISVGIQMETSAGADPGEVKWVNFHPPFSDSTSFVFFSYPSNIEIILISLTLLQKFTPHFKILDPPLVRFGFFWPEYSVSPLEWST